MSINTFTRYANKIGHQGDVDWYSVSTAEAGTLTIDLEVPSSLNYELEAYDRCSGTKLCAKRHKSEKRLKRRLDSAVRLSELLSAADTPTILFRQQRLEFLRPAIANVLFLKSNRLIETLA